MEMTGVYNLRNAERQTDQAWRNPPELTEAAEETLAAALTETVSDLTSEGGCCYRSDNPHQLLYIGVPGHQLAPLSI